MIQNYSRSGRSPRGNGPGRERRSFHPGTATNRFESVGYRGGQRSKRPILSFDVSHFINKAVITEEAEHFVPEHAFGDFAVAPELKRAIAARGYTLPTPIQDRAIPHIIRGDDLVGIANTGTGKTGAFLIPLINKAFAARNERVLVVVPTRELANQIEQEFVDLSGGLRIRAVSCVGGVPIERQKRRLRENCSFVIGTPGRLKDLLQSRSLNLSTFATVVLDEADRMLDMGFIKDMRIILSECAAKRQTLFFSATISHEIEKLISEFLNNPVRISVKTGDTAREVEQDVIRVPEGKMKMDILHDLLIQPEFSKVLIFGRTKHGVERLSKDLKKRGFMSESIHGNKTQSRREKALDLFKKNHAQVLVATDVAARGLDIADVSHVINFDLPATREDYIHRIGRTGRAGKKGKALTFV
ncbi:DEAD/DEAH box helicase [bacterium]|nr:DEAD/DEAH box helicase [bacterium]MCI0565896.1 DEAD/DEAH box helicase [bacterium]